MNQHQTVLTLAYNTRIKQPTRRIKILNHTIMNFKEELQTLIASHNSPKLENVKNILKNKASDGENTATLDSDLYDKWVVNWLQSQGCEVTETLDQRQGHFLRVTW